MPLVKRLLRMPLVLAHYAYASLIVMKNKLKNIKKFAKKRAAAADDNDAEAHALDAKAEAEANTVDAVAEEESNKRKAPASEKGQSCQKRQGAISSICPPMCIQQLLPCANPSWCSFARRAEVFASLASDSSLGSGDRTRRGDEEAQSSG